MDDIGKKSESPEDELSIESKFAEIVKEKKAQYVPDMNFIEERAGDKAKEYREYWDSLAVGSYFSSEPSKHYVYYRIFFKGSDGNLWTIRFSYVELIRKGIIKPDSSFDFVEFLDNHSPFEKVDNRMMGRIIVWSDHHKRALEEASQSIQEETRGELAKKFEL